VSAADAPRTDILLVEADPAEAELAGRCLRSRVTIARNADEAARLADALAPKLVLLNPRLPDGDGTALLQRLRQHPHLATTPVVILSSDDAPADVARALSHGANSFVVKPVRFEALRAALSEVESYWLDRHAAL
jgi:DNA-binding response OmpR family regulator